MKISQPEIALLRESVFLLQPDEQAASERFYQRQFEIAPEVRQMLPAEVSEQGMKFMSTLGVIPDHLDQPLALDSYLDELAKGSGPSGSSLWAVSKSAREVCPAAGSPRKGEWQ